MLSIRTGLILILAVGLLAGSAIGVAAQDEAPAPVGFGGRVEVPEAGYAISLPDDWVTVRPAAGDLEAIIEALGEIEPELAALIQAQLTGNVSLSLIALAPWSLGAQVANCNVVSLPHGGLPPEFIVAQNLAYLAGLDLPSGPDVSTLDLPLGDVTQIDYEMSMAAQDLVLSAWLYVDAEQLHVLTCTGAERPDDSWVSIAETFEFLPGE